MNLKQSRKCLFGYEKLRERRFNGIGDLTDLVLKHRLENGEVSSASNRYTAPHLGGI